MRTETIAWCRRLPTAAVIISLAAVTVAVVIAFLVFERQFQRALEQREALFLDKARSVVLRTMSAGARPDSRLPGAIGEAWRETPGRAADERLIVVGRGGRLIYSTFGPAAAGNRAAGGTLTGRDGSELSLESLIESNSEFSGRYLSTAGEPMLAAFLPVPGLDLLVGVHRPLASLENEIRADLGLLVAGLAGICLILVLSTGLILFFSYRKSETVLTESVEQYDELTGKADEVFWTVASDWRKVYYISPSYEDLWGRPCAGLYRNPGDWLDAVIDEDRGPVIAEIERRAAGGVISEAVLPEFRVRRPDGTVRWVLARGFPVHDEKGNVYRIAGISEDITERKLAGEALRKSTESLQLALHSASMGTWEWDLRENRVNWSAETLDIFGVNEQEFGGTYEAYLEFVAPDERDRVDGYVRSFLAGNRDSSEIRYEHEIIRADGKSGWIEVRGTIMTDRGGEVDGMIGICADITARKLAEIKLRESEEKLESIVRTIPDIIYRLDAEGRVTFINDAVRQYGYEPDELMGREMLELVCKPDREKAMYRLNERRTGRRSTRSFELRLKRKDQLSADFEIRSDIISDMPVFLIDAEGLYDGNDGNGGVFLGTQGVARDITERKQAEDRLRFQAMLLDDIQDMIIATDLERRIIYVNERECTVLKKSANELIGRIVSDVGKELQQGGAALQEIIEETLANGFWRGEVVNRFADGREIILDTRTSIVHGENGRPVGMVGISTEITERKQAEDKLLFQAVLLDDIQDMIIATDLGGRIIYVNERECTVLKKSADELIGSSVSDLGEDPQRGATQQEIIEETLANGFWRGEVVNRTADGREIILDTRTSIVRGENGRPVGMVGISTDITERKRAEEALRESEEKYRLLFDSSDVMVSVFDIQGICLLMNRKTAALFGGEPADFIGKSFEQLHPDAGREFVRRTREVIETGQSKQTEDEVIFPRGKRWVISMAHPVRDGRGNIYAAQLISHDITERKRAEEALSESEEQYRTLVDRVNSIILRWDPEGKVIFLNKFGRDLFGFSEEEIVGRHVVGTIVPETDSSGRDLGLMIDDILHNPRKYASNQNENVCKDGRRVWVEWTNEPVTGAGGELVEIFTTGIDITARKLLEEEQVKAAKLESIGLLAGGIAHDFNNILTAIVGNISLAKMSVEKEKGKTAKLLAQAEKSAMRAKDLTQQLLTFARGGEPVKKVFDLGELLTTTAQFVLRGSKVKCDFMLPSEPCRVEADEGQIGQVVNNLLINAVQAMPGGGRVTVSAEVFFAGSDSSLPLDVGRYVKITVRDQGEGIAPDQMSKIFDPYYTTKPTGSGLGLATSHSIVKRHGGHITVESEKGNGSAFHVYLPASTAEIDVIDDNSNDEPLGRRRILVMDDEKDILAVVSRMLELIGQEVEVAPDGTRAVELYRKALERARPFDMVILDLTIPGGMGGNDTLARLKEIDPAVTAIVSSGYFNDPVISNPGKYGFKGYISKPYRIEELRKVLRSVTEE